jgi:hypothetical protein
MKDSVHATEHPDAESFQVKPVEDPRSTLKLRVREVRVLPSVTPDAIETPQSFCQLQWNIHKSGTGWEPSFDVCRKTCTRMGHNPSPAAIFHLAWRLLFPAGVHTTGSCQPAPTCLSGHLNIWMLLVSDHAGGEDAIVGRRVVRRIRSVQPIGHAF